MLEGRAGEIPGLAGGGQKNQGGAKGLEGGAVGRPVVRAGTQLRLECLGHSWDTGVWVISFVQSSRLFLDFSHIALPTHLVSHPYAQHVLPPKSALCAPRARKSPFKDRNAFSDAGVSVLPDISFLFLPLLNYIEPTLSTVDFYQPGALMCIFNFYICATSIRSGPSTVGTTALNDDGYGDRSHHLLHTSSVSVRTQYFTGLISLNFYKNLVG